MTDSIPKEEVNNPEQEESEKVSFSEASKMTTSRRIGKRGRKPAKVDVKAKLERSRHSARECRARKKLRYQYLEELVTSREKAIYTLRKELELQILFNRTGFHKYRQHCITLDKGKLPPNLYQRLEVERKRGMFADEDVKIPRTKDWCQLTLDSSDESQDPEEVLPPLPRESYSSKQTTENQYVGKGKGSGKSSGRQTLRDNRNIANGATSMDTSQVRAASVNSNMDTIGSISQPIMAAKTNIGQFALDSMATGSPFAMDTPSIDTSYHDDDDRDGGNQTVLATKEPEYKLSSSRDDEKPTTSYQEQFKTINMSVLFSDSGSSSSPDSESTISTTLRMGEQPGLRELNTADIGDLLDIIEHVEEQQQS